VNDNAGGGAIASMPAEGGDAAWQCTSHRLFIRDGLARERVDRARARERQRRRLGDDDRQCRDERDEVTEAATGGHGCSMPKRAVARVRWHLPLTTVNRFGSHRPRARRHPRFRG